MIERRGKVGRRQSISKKGLYCAFYNSPAKREVAFGTDHHDLGWRGLFGFVSAPRAKPKRSAALSLDPCNWVEMRHHCVFNKRGGFGRGPIDVDALTSKERHHEGPSDNELSAGNVDEVVACFLGSSKMGSPQFREHRMSREARWHGQATTSPQMRSPPPHSISECILAILATRKM